MVRFNLNFGPFDSLHNGRVCGYNFHCMNIEYILLLIVFNKRTIATVC